MIIRKLHISHHIQNLTGILLLVLLRFLSKFGPIRIARIGLQILVFYREILIDVLSSKPGDQLLVLLSTLGEGLHLLWCGDEQQVLNVLNRVQRRACHNDGCLVFLFAEILDEPVQFSGLFEVETGCVQVKYQDLRTFQEGSCDCELELLEVA